MYDIIYISDKKDTQYQKLKKTFPLIKIANNVETAQRICLTNFYWLVFDDIEIVDNFVFDYTPDEWSNDYVHVFLNKDTYDGVALIPKHRKITQHELDYRFFVNRKEVEIVASNPKPYDLFWNGTKIDVKTCNLYKRKKKRGKKVKKCSGWWVFNKNKGYADKYFCICMIDNIPVRYYLIPKNEFNKGITIGQRSVKYNKFLISKTI